MVPPFSLPSSPAYGLHTIHKDSGFFGALARFIITANGTPNTLGKPHRHSTLMALLAGALLALGHAPTYVFWGVYVAVPVIVWLLVSAPTGKGAFYRGFLFGLGYFAVGYYWLAFSMTVDSKHLWLIPFSLLGLPALYGIGTGVLGWLVYGLQHRLSPALSFAVLWVAYEMIRGSGTLAFPWLQVGYLAGSSEGLMQGAALGGIYGLSLLFLGMAGLMAQAPFVGLVNRRALYSTALLLPLALLIWGNGRVAAYPTGYTDTVVRLVHPNIAQRDKWDRAKMADNLQKLVTLSNEPLGRDHPLYGRFIDTVIWPETAYTYATVETPQLVQQVNKAMPNAAPLITGALRLEKPGAYDRIYNSVQVFKGGTVSQSYDKMHLVPFGEFIPYADYLPDFLVAINGTAGMIPGTQGHFLTVGGIQYRPLICYEIAFAQTVGGHFFQPPETESARPRVLLNITNDGWFGNTSGPYQHLDITRMRAIEQGLPILRVANRGISAVIDPVGRIVKALPLTATGTITTLIPKGLPHTPIKAPTPWLRYGNAPVMGFMIVMLLINALIKHRHARRHS